MNITNLNETSNILYNSNMLNRPYQKLINNIVNVARLHKQSYITLWYPQQFGKLNITYNILDNDNDNQDILINKFIKYNKLISNNYLYTSLIQEFYPTRTGLNELKDSSAVWLTKVNNIEAWKIDETIEENW